MPITYDWSVVVKHLVDTGSGGDVAPPLADFSSLVHSGSLWSGGEGTPTERKRCIAHILSFIKKVKPPLYEKFQNTDGQHQLWDQYFVQAFFRNPKFKVLKKNILAGHGATSELPLAGTFPPLAKYPARISWHDLEETLLGGPLPADSSFLSEDSFLSSTPSRAPPTPSIEQSYTPLPSTSPAGGVPASASTPLHNPSPKHLHHQRVSETSGRNLSLGAMFRPLSTRPAAGRSTTPKTPPEAVLLQDGIDTAFREQELLDRETDVSNREKAVSHREKKVSTLMAANEQREASIKTGARAEESRLHYLREYETALDHWSESETARFNSFHASLESLRREINHRLRLEGRDHQLVSPPPQVSPSPALRARQQPQYWMRREEEVDGASPGDEYARPSHARQSRAEELWGDELDETF